MPIGPEGYPPAMPVGVVFAALAGGPPHGRERVGLKCMAAAMLAHGVI
jgi:hypothetical protein